MFVTDSEVADIVVAEAVPAVIVPALIIVERIVSSVAAVNVELVDVFDGWLRLVTEKESTVRLFNDNVLALNAVALAVPTDKF